MDTERPNGKPADHLANERTFLAWVRTSIGIMAFGFVVVKFSLFVKQISLLIGKETTSGQHSSSAVIGIVLVAAGAVSSVIAYVRYKTIERRLKEDRYENSSLPATLLIVFISAISIALIVYLVGNI